MALPYPNSPALSENVATSIDRMEQNMEYLDGILTESSYKMLYKTYNMATTTGAVNITGVGFQPTSAIVIAMESTGDSMSWGFCDSDSNSYCVYKTYVPGAGSSSTKLMYLLQAVGPVSQECVLTSYDSDGLTLTFAETGECAAVSMALIIFCMQ